MKNVKEKLQVKICNTILTNGYALIMQIKPLKKVGVKENTLTLKHKIMIIFYQHPILGSQYMFIKDPAENFSEKNRNQKRKNVSEKNKWGKDR